MVDNNLRMAKATDLKARIDATKPITDWGFSCNVWTRPDAQGGQVRVYVNDKKGRPAAILAVDLDGNIKPEWQPGHSMTRNELRALGI